MFLLSWNVDKVTFGTFYNHFREPSKAIFDPFQVTFHSMSLSTNFRPLLVPNHHDP